MSRKEMSRIRSSSARISENTPVVFLCLIWRAPFNFFRGQSCSQWDVHKRILWSGNNFWLIWVFPDSIKYSFVIACRADPSGMNFLKVLVDIILKLNRKILSDSLIGESFIIKLIDCSQEGDIIIHELKRKTRGLLGILRKTTAGRSYDAMTA